MEGWRGGIEFAPHWWNPV